jgi:hypothetical protein
LGENFLDLAETTGKFVQTAKTARTSNRRHARFRRSESKQETPAGASTSYALAKGTNEFGVWAGGSPDSSKVFGNIENRKLLLFALRYGRILAAWESMSLEYTLDIFPAAVVFEPHHVRRGSSTIYGAGLSPLGFKINFAQQSWIQPFVAASVGFLYFQDDIPVRHSSPFNFTPEFGLGVQFFLAPKKSSDARIQTSSYVQCQRRPQ